MIDHNHILNQKKLEQATKNSFPDSKVCQPNRSTNLEPLMGSPVSHNVTQHPRLNSSLIKDLYLPIDNPKQSNDQDRFNHTQISQILRLLKTCIHLYKKSAIQSDQILPKYMFQNDIIEFKNEKILGKLRECTKLY